MVDWSYQNPEQWGNTPENNLCRLGKEQSPINLKLKKADVLLEEHVLGILYDTEPFNVSLDHKGLKLEPIANEHKVIYQGDLYWLETIFFHSPSEHQMDDESFPMEIQFYHRSALGKELAIGLFFVEGDYNMVIGDLFMQESKRFSLNCNSLITNDQGCFVYQGSLTHPPCREGIEWIILKNPLTLSKKQLDGFRSHCPSGQRPVQPLNKRAILIGHL